MRKIILLTLLVLPLSVLAQSRGDRLVGTYGFKIQSAKIDSTTIERQVLIQLHTHYKQIPLIEDDRVIKAKELTKKHCTDNKCSFKQVLKAIFLGSKFPWETDKDYQLRKQIECTPAGQPFK